MKFVSRISAIVSLVLLAHGCSDPVDSIERDRIPSPATDTLRIETLRSAVLRNGFTTVANLQSVGDMKKQEVGGKLFESRDLSLNGNISCQDCHLDKFGSTDGLPNAVGAGASGEGAMRIKSGGQIVPRNVLPLWGRGGPGFDTFFWDGKVQSVNGSVISQFGSMAPSKDPLTVAVHLPFVELREMISDNPEVREALVTEEVSKADIIYQTLTERIRRDPLIGPELAKAYDKSLDELMFDNIGDAIAQFIRHKFRIQGTKLHRFVFEDGDISTAELNGGITFYGRGRCSACHTGPYFSDFKFHSIPVPQLGFGKNGFGNDEGRYNVTFDPKDRFLFRTPPLYNTSKTGPYGHSGSIVTLERIVVAHFDPLRDMDPKEMTVQDRVGLYLRMKAVSEDKVPAPLSDGEVEELVAFIKMLDF